MGGALIASGYDAWHVERRAVRGLRKSNFPAIKGDVSYFEAMDWQRISGQDKQLLDLAYRLELKAGEALVRFEARIDLVNSGAESRALDWRFSAKKKDGGIVEFAPTPVQWSHPHWWPNVEYLSFNEFEGEYLKPGKTYRIFVCLTTKNVNPKDDYESLNQSFRAILKDETGAEVVCE
jgi:phage baseplate assembly protein W